MALCAAAAERNKQPILNALRQYLNLTASSPEKLLEISSGSGQHVAHIAPNYPNITFQPTEVEKASLRSIQAYVDENGLGNVEPPQFLDVRSSSDQWLNGAIADGSYDYILNINMMHISDFSCTEGLFAGSGRILKPGGLLFTYGPYAVDGVITPESNVRFDLGLRQSNASWGLRDIQRQLVPLALKHGIDLKAVHDLPANNKLLVWKKQDGS
ncbi:Chromosome 16 open reading frame 13 [Nesidiocoris tenuis]|uniref:Chromosome 16 open reading frame 13 n=1 Tax=Nesidiocoris tenuis TaxID=355587 RepID=A0ABN7ANX0_9HEMI|nr:Chromosome 16 open reading frame 13 [Nesidiocoris tenuis]